MNGRAPSQEVIVVDSEKKFLEYVHPGKARWLIRTKKAKIFSQEPFAIMLLRTVEPSSIRRRDPMSTPRIFTDYFKEEKDVYVQNLANAQVSVEFPIDNNRTEGFTFPPARDPINLTQHVPFEGIKRSMDFRKMLSRRPTTLQLLSKEEYDAYYSKKARSRGMVDSSGKPDMDAAIDATEDQRRRQSDRVTREPIAATSPDPIHEVVERGSGPGGATHFGERQRVAPSEVAAEDEIINPRVLHLCNQVKNEIPEEERMPAKELLEAIEAIPNLSMDDLEYVRAHAFYKTVKKWAKQRMSEMSTEEEAEDEKEASAQA
jgi:hypothetical protein